MFSCIAQINRLPRSAAASLHIRAPEAWSPSCCCPYSVQSTAGAMRRLSALCALCVRCALAAAQSLAPLLGGRSRAGVCLMHACPRRRARCRKGAAKDTSSMAGGALGGPTAIAASSKAPAAATSRPCCKHMQQGPSACCRMTAQCLFPSPTLRRCVLAECSPGKHSEKIAVLDTWIQSKPQSLDVFRRFS